MFMEMELVENFGNYKILMQEDMMGESYIAKFYAATADINPRNTFQSIVSYAHMGCDKDKVATLFRICTHPDFQDKGIGTEIMRLVQQYAHEHDCVMLSTKISEKGALARRRNFYDRLGFATCIRDRTRLEKTIFKPENKVEFLKQKFDDYDKMKLIAAQVALRQNADIKLTNGQFLG